MTRSHALRYNTRHTLEDSSVLLTVSVTQSDIERASPLTCVFCPVAIALERRTGVRWIVNALEARPVITQGRYRPLPAVACDFIRAFDAGEEVFPIEFPFNTDEPEPEPVPLLAV